MTPVTPPPEPVNRGLEAGGVHCPSPRSLLYLSPAGVGVPDRSDGEVETDRVVETLVGGTSGTHTPGTARDSTASSEGDPRHDPGTGVGRPSFVSTPSPGGSRGPSSLGWGPPSGPLRATSETRRRLRRRLLTVRTGRGPLWALRVSLTSCPVPSRPGTKGHCRSDGTRLDGRDPDARPRVEGSGVKGVDSLPCACGSGGPTTSLVLPRRLVTEVAADPGPLRGPELFICGRELWSGRRSSSGPCRANLSSAQVLVVCQPRIVHEREEVSESHGRPVSLGATGPSTPSAGPQPGTPSTLRTPRPHPSPKQTLTGRGS